MFYSFPRITHFNPRSPWGERPNLAKGVRGQIAFQSTLPVGGATSLASKSMILTRYFNPRSPWGERLNITAEYFT